MTENPSFYHKRIVVIDNDEQLTQRQKEIAQLLCDGTTSDKSIASRLGISPITVKNHIHGGHKKNSRGEDQIPSKMGILGIIDKLAFGENNQENRILRNGIPYYLLALEIAEFIELGEKPLYWNEHAVLKDSKTLQ